MADTERDAILDRLGDVESRLAERIEHAAVMLTVRVDSLGHQTASRFERVESEWHGATARIHERIDGVTAEIVEVAARVKLNESFRDELRLDQASRAGQRTLIRVVWGVLATLIGILIGIARIALG